MKDSLQGRLTLMLVAAILLLGVLAGASAFVSAYRDSIRTQDDTLMQVGSLMRRLGVRLPDAGVVGTYPGSDHETRIVVQRLDRGEQALPLPAPLQEGFHTLFIGHEYYRVFVQTLPAGERVALAQETDARERIALHIAWRALLPYLLLVPLLVLMVRRITRRLFAPVLSLSQDIDQRSDEQLQAIPTDRLPTEIRPLVEAINRLLARVEASMAAQRRFVADAAHELRTPLTALLLQAERLGEADMSVAARERLERLGSGIERAKQLVQQMLALARAQAGPQLELTPVALQEVVRTVLEDLLPMAQHKQIDLGVDTPLHYRVRSHAFALGQLLSNLIDNAVRYTPPGGTVSLCARQQGQVIRLEISDTGPGISEQERQRIFQAFYRGEGVSAPGSGLGLAIVQTLAQRLHIGLRLELADPVRQTGLRVILELPLTR